MRVQRITITERAGGAHHYIDAYLVEGAIRDSGGGLPHITAVTGQTMPSVLCALLEDAIRDGKRTVHYSGAEYRIDVW
jgi:hypothetical protein